MKGEKGGWELEQIGHITNDDGYITSDDGCFRFFQENKFKEQPILLILQATNVLQEEVQDKRSMKDAP